MIGILGGTFDPVHFGHLRTAQQVYQQLSLERVIFVPAADPPHRPSPVASIEHRIRMLQLVLPMYAGFELDDRERRLGGISYTVRTLESFRDELGDYSLGLIMGADAFAGFETWHRWQHILDLAHIVVMNRPGFSVSALPEWAQARTTDDIDLLRNSAGGRIYFLAVEPEAISATDIRMALARNESVEGRVPDAVIEYIKSNDLYKQVSK
ncbi:MAG: nicotinate-nucleotide adenylyltransferase [Acidiferrobacterales bacterium]|nr:nicotinate-nucleotide adenylyltransferase [Acidiferrobacterales bacterium]